MHRIMRLVAQVFMIVKLIQGKNLKQEGILSAYHFFFKSLM